MTLFTCVTSEQGGDPRAQTVKSINYSVPLGPMLQNRSRHA
ncbi:hypothetical protein CLV44_12164 [Marinobacterium halophilum]|uniref:Uncharacterized protein n=1 Tax=Marinobacterium halophilum TaxID=267374 RepID=A0A2P8ER85_9GAMM|nr:hypothetical protein CLV44_12164 [Marinobacterium halophilum]